MSGLRKGSAGVFGAVCLSAALAGCSLGGGGGSAQNEPGSTLKVMYYDERSFNSQMGLVYSALHPNVDIQVVTNRQTAPPDPNQDMAAAFDKFVEDEQPDVLMLSTDQLSDYAADGKLLELDSLTEQKDYKKDTLIPGLLDYMKGLGEGHVYGLPVNFYSQAIFYNKDLFAKYGIAPPEDRMTWDQLIDLARRFPTDGAKDKRVYGLALGYNSDLFQLGSMIGSSQNLSLVNASTKQVTLDTPAWKKAFQTAADGLKSGMLYTEDPSGFSGSSYEDFLLRDPFISGKVAMKFEGAGLMSQIKEAQTYSKDKAVANWDIVTVPVNPENPDVSANMSFSQIFAINAKSVNVDAAKDFLEYITGEEYARVASKLDDGTFTVRTTYMKDDDNHHLEAFYSLKPSNSALYKDADKLPQNFFGQFMPMAQAELKNANDGKTSLDDALASAQTKGQKVLDEELAKAPDETGTAGPSVQSATSDASATAAQ